MFAKENDHQNKITRCFIRESIPNEDTPIIGQNDFDVKEKMTNENLISYFYLSRRECFESDSFLPQTP